MPELFALIYVHCATCAELLAVAEEGEESVKPTLLAIWHPSIAAYEVLMPLIAKAAARGFASMIEHHPCSPRRWRVLLDLGIEAPGPSYRGAP
jgi:hypothetical protein